jgi:hypothetical protein
MSLSSQLVQHRIYDDNFYLELSCRLDKYDNWNKKRHRKIWWLVFIDDLKLENVTFMHI